MIVCLCVLCAVCVCVWLRVSACVLEQGMAEAQYVLGMLYLGQSDVAGMKQDQAKGLHWIRKAASKDHGASSSNGEAVVKMCQCVIEKCPSSLTHPSLFSASLHADAANDSSGGTIPAGAVLAQRHWRRGG